MDREDTAPVMSLRCPLRARGAGGWGGSFDDFAWVLGVVLKQGGPWPNGGGRVGRGRRSVDEREVGLLEGRI